MNDTATVTAVCGHDSDVPAQLCTRCTSRLHQRLTRLPRLYVALAAWLPPASRRPELGSRSTAEAPLPVRQEVLDLRGPGGIVGVLEDWRAAVHDARGFTAPTHAGSVGQRIAAAATALDRHLTWISLTWDQGAALAAEIGRLESRALAVIEPPDPTVPLGPCPCDLGDGQICGQTIRVPRGTQDVRCRACGTVYGPETWLNLRRWMDADRDTTAA